MAASLLFVETTVPSLSSTHRLPSGCSSICKPSTFIDRKAFAKESSAQFFRGRSFSFKAAPSSMQPAFSHAVIASGGDWAAATVDAPAPSVYWPAPKSERLVAVGAVRQYLMQWRPKNREYANRTVYIVRHGQSSWNVGGKIQGKSDYSVLTPRGESQAELVGEALKDKDWDIVFASPLQRARKTAEIILSRNNKFDTQEKHQSMLGYIGNQYGGFPLTFLDSLKEINLSDWEGMTKEEVKLQYPEQYEKWAYAPVELEMSTGARPVVDIWSQAIDAWNSILSVNANKILVVAHNAMNKALIGTAWGLPPSSYRQIIQSNGGISEIKFSEDGSIEVERMNQIGHMKLPDA